MNFGVFSGFFWGVILISAGVLMVIKNLLHLNIPIFKLLLGIFFVYLGISMLAGGFSHSEEKEIIFSSGTMTVSGEQDDYNVIFGTGTVDFTSLTPCDTVRTYKVNVIFSSAEIIINPSIPVEIKSSAVFASAQLSDSKRVSFGSKDYATAPDSLSKTVIIEANAVFGSIDVMSMELKPAVPETDTSASF
ncbi:MAG: hypothetical protein AB7T10_07485 [bacterium]